MFPPIIKGEKANMTGAIGALFVRADTSGAITEMITPPKIPVISVAISKLH